MGKSFKNLDLNYHPSFVTFRYPLVLSATLLNF